MRLYLLISLLGILFLPITCWILTIIYCTFTLDINNLVIAIDYTYKYITNLEGVFISWLIFGNLTYMIIIAFIGVMEGK